MFSVSEIARLIDLTELTGKVDLTAPSDPDGRITRLCSAAVNTLGRVAALCVYPQSVSFTRNCLQDDVIPIATVANFPSGNDSIEEVKDLISYSLDAGANEIDLVIPHEKLIQGDVFYVQHFLSLCRESSKNYCLKVIIESALLTKKQIETATYIVSEIGADFVKTSTGKIPGQGATLEAVETILRTLKKKKAGQTCTGLKISGGIGLNNIQEFLSLIEKIMGREWINPKNLRIGASSLLKDLLRIDCGLDEFG